MTLTDSGCLTVLFIDCSAVVVLPRRGTVREWTLLTPHSADFDMPSAEEELDAPPTTFVYVGGLSFTQPLEVLYICFYYNQLHTLKNIK